MTRRPMSDEAAVESRPAVEIDLDAALAAALAASTRDRDGNGICAVEDAARDFAAECLQDALGALALEIRDLGPGETMSAASGWRARPAPDRRPFIIGFTLEHPGEPGAWHVAVHLRAVLTEEARVRETEIEARIDARITAQGGSRMDRIMARLRPGTSDPDEAAHRALLEAPGSFRPAAPGDAVDRIEITALDLGPAGGRPRGLERCDVATSFDPQAPRDVWWPGLQAILSPTPRGLTDDRLRPSGLARGASPHVAMEILSDLVRSAGLAPTVARRHAEIADRFWRAHGDDAGRALQEAGHAIVHASGGFLDGPAVERLKTLEARMQAKAVDRHLEGWIALARRFAAEGVSSPETAFACNDGRDVAHAEINGAVTSLWTSTQNGTYRVDIVEDAQGAPASVLALRVEGAAERLIGRFEATAAGLAPNYGSRGGPAIEITIRQARDISEILSSLASLACVFEEERPTAAP